MCYCCCPPAVTALLCLWVKSGFSKGSVAGALTFFPPNPAFYKFQRCSSTGEELPDDDDDDDDNDNDDNDDIDDENFVEIEGGNESSTDPSSSSSLRENKSRKKKQIKKSTNTKTKNNNKKQEESLSDRTKKLQEQSRRKYNKDSRDASNGVTYKFIPDSRIPKPRFDGSITCTKLYNRKAKSYIATVIYRVKNSTADTKTLIYSHGNATDIGAMSYMQAILAKNLKINVVMYDYSGYGESGGMPLENNTYSDIETVYDYVCNYVANGKEDRIIVYGQSVGSGPTCYIATKRNVNAIILHSPFTSGMRVLTPSRALACLDIFPNIDRIKKTKCPVFIIHGVQDEEVDISHGHSLYEAVDPIFKRDHWWVPDRGHNDITEGPGKMAEYIRRLRAFIQSLDNVDSSSADEGIETTLVQKGVMIR